MEILTLKLKGGSPTHEPCEMFDPKILLNQMYGQPRIPVSELPIPKLESTPVDVYLETMKKIQSGYLSRACSSAYLNVHEARFITKNKKVKFFAPLIPDKNYPIKGYFNEEKLTTVLVFKDGSKVKVTSDTKSRNKAHVGITIALAKRILGSNSSINSFYKKFNSNPQTESMMYGAVMSYFVSNSIVKNPETFDLWMVEFMTNYLEVAKPKVKKED